MARRHTTVFGFLYRWNSGYKNLNYLRFYGYLENSKHLNERYLEKENTMRFVLKILRLVLLRMEAIEKYLVEKHKNDEAGECTPIFIIGAPRTGSTILYQIITNFWDVGYINNFECSLSKNIVLASIVSRKIFGDQAHNNFTSYHGATIGSNSPSECGQFWYRWFPKERHYVDQEELNIHQRMCMKATVKGIIKAKKKVIVFKNMNCGQRIRALSQIFPKAIFLFCTRDPLYTTQSLLKVRQRVHGNHDKWWSIMPKEYDQIKSLSPIEQVVAQVHSVEQQIQVDLNERYPDRYLKIKYEDFCKDPKSTLQDMKTFLEKIEVRIKQKDEYELSFLNNKNREMVDISTMRELKNNIAKYF